MAWSLLRLSYHSVHICAELIPYISMFILLNLPIIHKPQIFRSLQCFVIGALNRKFCTEVVRTFIIYVNTKVYIPQHNKYILNVIATGHPASVHSWIRQYHRLSLQICNCNMITLLNTALQNARTGWGKITSLNFKVNNKKSIRDTKILFLDSETTTWKVLNHSNAYFVY
jgi:hypothetical protein